MIAAITLCINHSTKVRKLGLDSPRVDFDRGYNIVIGSNGSGKSTLLRAIASCSMCVVEKSSGDDEVKYITTETLNPLGGGSFSSRHEMVQGIRSIFKSHGQGVLDTLRSQRHGYESTVLIDSPETGQDFENSALIHEGLLKMSERYQVIVATNSLVFMRGGNLIDLGQGTLARLVQATGKLLRDFDAPGRNSRDAGRPAT